MTLPGAGAGVLVPGSSCVIQGPERSRDPRGGRETEAAPPSRGLESQEGPWGFFSAAVEEEGAQAGADGDGLGCPGVDALDTGDDAGAFVELHDTSDVRIVATVAFLGHEGGADSDGGEGGEPAAAGDGLPGHVGAVAAGADGAGGDLI